jgi:hypothetical protein
VDLKKSREGPRVLFLCQYLYFCASKASKLRWWERRERERERERETKRERDTHSEREIERECVSV